MIQPTISSFLGLRSGLVRSRGNELSNTPLSSLRHVTTGQGVPHGSVSGTLLTFGIRQKPRLVIKSPDHNLLNEAKALKLKGDHQESDTEERLREQKEPVRKGSSKAPGRKLRFEPLPPPRNKDKGLDPPLTEVKSQLKGGRRKLGQ